MKGVFTWCLSRFLICSKFYILYREGSLAEGSVAEGLMRIRHGTKNCQGWRRERNAYPAQVPQVTTFPYCTSPTQHPAREQEQCWSEHSTHYKYSLHNYDIISIYVENKFPFGTPVQLYWHLVNPLIFRFLHLQKSTSESFLRLRNGSSCTWEFPLWPENPKRGAGGGGLCFKHKRNVKGRR